METADNHPKCVEAMQEENEELMEIKKEGKKKTEENLFAKLFDAVLQQNRGELSDDELANGVREAAKTFIGRISGACDKKIYNYPGIICGFFHRYSPLFAEVTRNKFLVAFRHCEALRSCFTNLGSEEKNPLKIVDLGSGAGSASVGLYSAVYERDFPFKYLKVTATDYNEKWERFFNGNVEKLQSGEEFGNASKLFKEKKIECSYALVDLVKDNAKEIRESEEIKKADIILIKGFLSILETDEMIILSLAVADTMKPGSLLVAIESPSYEDYFHRGLRMVYTTKKSNTSSDSWDDSKPQSTSTDSKLEPKVSSSSSDVDDVKKDLEYVLKAEGREYGKGFAPGTNQQIFVYVKDQ